MCRVSELGGEDVACAHADRGCKGTYTVAYTGPKKWLPAELANVRCRCDDSGGAPAPAAPAVAAKVAEAQAQEANCGGAAPPPVAAPAAEGLNGGLDEAAALSAALSTSLEPLEPGRRTTSVLRPEAPESLPRSPAVDTAEGSPPPPPRDHASPPQFGEATVPLVPLEPAGELTPEPEPADLDVTLTQEERELAGKYLQAPADEDVAECAICCDELRLTSAAMRCAGGAGRAHYFHAACLSDWATQCRSNGTAPSCPECRGPVQIRRQKLFEFLRESEQAGGDAQPGLHELAQATHGRGDSGGARDESGDDDEWADVKEGLWTQAHNQY